MTTKVITGPNTRFSYLNANEPKSINGSTPKYSASLIIPKEDTITINKIKAAIEQAYKEGESKLKGNGKSVPALSTLKTPLRDGDLERPDDEAYKNAYFVNANSPHNLVWLMAIVKKSLILQNCTLVSTVVLLLPFMLSIQMVTKVLLAV